MLIELTFDEDLDFDDSCVVGDIRLLSEGKIIEEKNTYLDSWIVGLIEALLQIQKGEDAQIDLVEESAPLLVRKINQELSINYKSQEIVVESDDQLETALKNAARDILKKFDGNQIAEQSELLKRISTFAIT